MAEAHSQYAAQAAGSGSPMLSPGNAAGSTGGSVAGVSLTVTAHEANSKLIEQVEALRLENRRLQEQSTDERRSLMIDNSNKLLSQERQMKAEIMELRSLHTGYEDRISQSAEELRVAVSKIHALESMNQQLEIAKKAAIEEQYRLRGDLKNIQQSVQASYRLETTQGIGAGSGSNNNGGSDNDTTLRLIEAKNDAKIRQLMNKMEFLKSQLETEKKTADDARNSLQLMQLKFEDLRNEHQERILKIENDQHSAIELIEQQLENQYSERMKELTTLQTKFSLIQNQLKESNEMEIILKQRDEQSKSLVAKNNSMQASLKTEIEQLRNQVNKMREEKELELLNQSNKQSQDAVIRRLDNERQYLKSQLSSEITHKNELQTEFTKSQQQLNEIQKQWKDDVDTLKDSNTLLTQSYNDKELKYKQYQTQLESELKHNQIQTKELKDGYIKIRDQLRMEQIALENANTQHRRLQEAYEEAQSDIIRYKKQEEINTDLHQTQIDAMNETIKEQEKRNNIALQKLKDELSGQFLDNAHAQTIMLRMKDEFTEEKLKLQQITGVIKLVEVLRRWKRCRIFNGFRRWYSNSNLIGAAKQFREQVEIILKKTTKDMHKDKLTALEVQKNDLNNKNQEYINAREKEWERALNDAMKNADETKNRELENAAEEYRMQLQQAETDYIFDLQNTRKECENEILLTIERKDKEIKQLNKEFQVDLELTLQDAMKKQEEALINKENEMNEIMLQELQLKEEELTRKHNKYIEKLTVENDFMLHQKQSQWKDDMDKLKLKLDSEYNITIHTLNEQHMKVLSDFNLEKEKDMESVRADMNAESERLQSKLRAEMHTEAEARVRELRSEWQEEFDARCAQQRSEFDVLLATKIEEYGKAVEAEKQRALKLEASKWKQALKDSSQNHELQSMKTKAEVANEKDKEMRIELQKLSDSYEIKRKQDLENHQNSLESVRRDHAVALERQANANTTAMERLRKELEISLKEQHDVFWTEKMNLEIGVLEQTHKNKLAKEQTRMDQLKQDFAQQSQNFALERGNFQRQVNQADERILQIEAMNKTDTATLRRKHEEDRREWEEQKAQELERLEEQHERQIEESNLAVEKRCQEDAERQLQEEATRLNEEMDRQVGQMQDESEKLISGLEQAMSNLRSEKTALTTELEGLSNKLEETEDCLYDLKQECKRVKMDNSLAVWKSVTKIFQMRQRFQEGIAQFDKEASKRYDEIKREMQVQLDHSTLTVLKLAALLQDSDTARITTQSILTSHRTTELISNRNKIQVMERDLERLTMEKDSLEEQKELIEGDIQQMEAQVRELEDLIRSHNQESSMSNGRINVAHARKKRRLDSDLEQLLESIEQKRHTMSQMDRRVTEKGHERDDLEMELIDIERKLVEILLEQQKMVLSRLDEGKMLADRTKVVLGVAQVTYPVPAEPTMDHVLEMGAQRRAEEARLAALEEDEEDHPSPKSHKGIQHKKNDTKKLKG